MFGLNRKKHVALTATPADHKDIANLHSQAFARGWSKSEIDSLAGQAGTVLLISRQVGDRDGRISGFNIVRIAGDEAEILSVAVDQRDRRNGVADMLMREAILRLRAERQAALLLEVDENNEPAVRLYVKLGFKVVGNRPGYYSNGGQAGAKERAMALVMRLDLV